MFARIYSKTHWLRSQEELGFHFLEEMGEVQEAIRKIATLKETEMEKLEELQQELVEEVADTISWCFSIVRKIADDAKKHAAFEAQCNKCSEVEGSPLSRNGLFTPNLTLGKVLWLEYGHEPVEDDPTHDHIKCPCCNGPRCTLEEIDWVLTQS